MIRAASVVRGDLLGDQLPRAPDYVRFVAVPVELSDGFRVNCFRFLPSVTPDCVDSTIIDEPYRIEPGTGVKLLPTSAGRHPPAYYAVVGIPSAVGVGGDYRMRGVGILIAAALVASAIASARRTEAPRLATIGVMFAMSPMVFFVFGIVNPSTTEIAGAIGLWTSGAVLVTEGERTGVFDPRLVSRVGIAGVVLVLSRGLSPLWIGLMGLVLLAFSSRDLIRRMFRERLVRVWTAVILAATLAQIAWVVIVKPLNEIGDPVDLSVAETIRVSLGRQWTFLRDMIGNFGWLDTPVPSLTVLIWLVAVGSLGLLCVSVAKRRQWLTMLGVLVLAVVVPVAIETSQAGTSGFVWQGRYTLPFAIGVPILAAVAVAASDAVAFAKSRLVTVLAVLFVVGHLVAYLQHLRRNTVGATSELLFFLDPVWSPPIAPWALTIIYTVVLTATAWFLVRPDGAESRRFDPRGEDEPTGDLAGAQM